ncbi:PREDICTED: F-box protein At5g65850-like [Ipomoea nil]|uniref:F-box protein At5g65850-like n=1 Tax=Ipomoea nil TaxID=35883 RepID=UPI000901E273|nr:PREDICTED: F-box protein At5g65850-like [Ipomoea nil]XP_019157535.1 PREDICTED: F-box protein At5g65850-like [Ipomoea nil]
MLKFFCLGIKSAKYERRSLENKCASESDGEKTSGSGLNSDLFLPNEIIIEILSWLPVDTLLRVKCVCKSWRATIQDRNFIEKHMSRARIVVECAAKMSDNNGNEKPYEWQCVRDGLVLERRNVFPKYRIRNPATKQKLDLPNPHGPLLFISMFFLSTSNDYKAVYIHHKEGTTSCAADVAVLTIGTDSSWRSLDIPSLHNMKSQRGQILRKSIAEVYYIIVLRDYEIVCLEMETENFTSVQIPERLFPDWNNIHPLNWRGKLALASVVGEKINIWVLESYKKQKWENVKVVFPLPLDSITNDNLIPFETKGDWLRISVNYEHRVAYNMRTNRVSTLISAPPGQKIAFVYKPSLVHFKGMTPVQN